MMKQSVLVIDRDDVKSALADFFARVLNDFDMTRQRLLEGKLHSEVPDLTTAADDELIRHYGEFDLGFALLSENPEADAVLIDMGGDTWTVAAKKETPV